MGFTPVTPTARMGNTSDGFSFHHPPSDGALSWAAALHQRAMLNSGIRSLFIASRVCRVIVSSRKRPG